MAFNLVLSTLETRCRQRADQEGVDQLDSPEFKSLISEFYAEVHSILVPARYFETEATINLSNLALPTDHFASIAISEVVDATGTRRPITGPIAVQDRVHFVGQVGPACVWDFEGANIALYPVPTTGTYKHLYIPQPTDLATAADSTVVDLVNMFGYRLVVWGVASVAKHKSESSQTRAVSEYERARAELEFWASKRSFHEGPPGVSEETRMLGQSRYRDVADFSVTRP